MKQFNKSNISEIEDNLVGIYMIKNNITNKYYIGQSLELKSSLKKHLSSYNTKSKKNLYPLYISINKHGIENFTFQVLFYEPKDINNISNQITQKRNISQNITPMGVLGIIKLQA